MTFQTNPSVRYPKGMRPLIVKYAEQINKLASRTIAEVTGEPRVEQWSPSVEPLGAGSWGVVFPTVDPRFILKVTADPTEGPIIATIMNEPNLHDHMGIIHYFALRQLPEDVVHRGKTFKLYVIVAERLMNVGGLLRAPSAREVEDREHRLRQIKDLERLLVRSNPTDPQQDRHLATLLSKIKMVAGELVKAKQRKRPAPSVVERLDDQYMELIGRINDGPLCDFFFQFRDVTGDGVLADVHLNNLGQRAVDWEQVGDGSIPLNSSTSYWVISDPGHSDVNTEHTIEQLHENPRRGKKPKGRAAPSEGVGSGFKSSLVYQSTKCAPSSKPGPSPVDERTRRSTHALVCRARDQGQHEGAVPGDVVHRV